MIYYNLTIESVKLDDKTKKKVLIYESEFLKHVIYIVQDFFTNSTPVSLLDTLI